MNWDDEYHVRLHRLVADLLFPTGSSLTAVKNQHGFADPLVPIPLGSGLDENNAVLVDVVDGRTRKVRALIPVIDDKKWKHGSEPLVETLRWLFHSGNEVYVGGGTVDEQPIPLYV